MTNSIAAAPPLVSREEQKTIEDSRSRYLIGVGGTGALILQYETKEGNATNWTSPGADNPDSILTPVGQ